MHGNAYIIGSAASAALGRLGALQRREDFDAYRTVDLVNIAQLAVQEAHAALPTDPHRAREMLIHGASRMLAAADRLEGAAPVEKVVALRAVS